MPTKKIRVGWDEARLYKIEINRRHRKCKTSANTACLTNRIIQPSSDISPICIPLSARRLATHRKGQYDPIDSLSVSV
jgi:hypothetical protein